MSIDLLELGDLSETGLSTYLARTIRGIGRAAGLNIRRESLKNTAIAKGSDQPSQAERAGQPPQALMSEQEELSFLGNTLSDSQISDTNSFWGGHDQFDLSYFLGLSGGVAQDTDWLNPALVDGESLDPSSSNVWDLTFGTG